MEVFTTRELEREYGLKSFNTGFGESVFGSEEPNPCYVLSDLVIGVYESKDYDFSDKLNSFNASGEEYVVEVDNPEPTIPKFFLEGPRESVLRLDQELMRLIDSKSSPDYYKQII